TSVDSTGDIGTPTKYESIRVLPNSDAVLPVNNDPKPSPALIAITWSWSVKEAPDPRTPRICPNVIASTLIGHAEVAIRDTSLTTRSTITALLPYDVPRGNALYEN